MSQRKPFPKAIAIVVALMFVAGLPGMFVRVAGAQAAAGTDFVPWGLWVAAYLFFSGLSAGAFPIATMPYVFGYKRFRPLVPLALLTSLVALSAALTFVLIDLGRPERALNVLLGANLSSMLTWVVAIYCLYGLLLVVMLAMTLRPHWAQRAQQTKSRIARWLAFGYEPSPEQERKDHKRLTWLGGVGLVVVLFLGGGVGSLFAVMGGRAFWHCGMFPITFVVSALVSGAALVLASASLVGRGGAAFKSTLLVLARLVGILLIVELIILPAETLILLRGGVPAHIAVIREIALGQHAWVFWVLQLGLGIVAALALLLLPKKANIATVSVAALYVLIGVFALRLSFVIPQGGEASYFPSLLEWNLVVFGVGLSGLLFMAGYRWLPVLNESAPIEFELASRRTENVSVTGEVFRKAA